MSDSERQMQAMMGFGGFDTTKNKGVEGNQTGAANLIKQRTWRQYMNRYVVALVPGKAEPLITSLSFVDVVGSTGTFISIFSGQALY